MNKIIEKYAELLVEYSLYIKKGERFLIQGNYLAEELIKAVYKKALQKGAYPELDISLNGTDKIFYDNANDDQLNDISPLTKYVTENYDARLRIVSPFNIRQLHSVPADKIKTVNMAGTELVKVFRKRVADGEVKWSVCVFPADSAAQEAGMSLQEYEDFVYGSCFLYDDNPIKSWEKLRDEQQRVADFLNTKKIIRYESSDVDVEFSTEGRIWLNSAGTDNMPSGEVYTGPVEDSINGTVRFSFPGYYMGQEIEDISLDIKDGEVVKWEAAVGKEFLDTIFEIPGARRFGEVAVGMNEGIQRFTKNMLFDEKIGGTVHMAIGFGFPETGSKNQSAIHWDMLADMRNGGRILADGEQIYENGKFTF